MCYLLALRTMGTPKVGIYQAFVCASFSVRCPLIVSLRFCALVFFVFYYSERSEELSAQSMVLIRVIPDKKQKAG